MDDPKRVPYDRSLAHRIGQRVVAKRSAFTPADLEHQHILEIITGSPEAAPFLASEFSTLYDLANYGSTQGYKRLVFEPGISFAVIGKLEVWLESQGRVGLGLTTRLLESLEARITPETTPEEMRGLLEEARSYVSQDSSDSV